MPDVRSWSAVVAAPNHGIDREKRWTRLSVSSRLQGSRLITWKLRNAPNIAIGGRNIGCLTGIWNQADGVLVDVSRMATEANFRFPTAISADLHARITPNKREEAPGQSYEGRLWDILFMAFITVLRQRSPDQASFEVGLFEAEAVRPTTPTTTP